MNPIWESSFKVRAFEVDANDRIKVSAIIDYFQDAASNDAERLNFGYTNFVPKGLIWVLSWAKFEFIRYPKFMEEVKIQSWGKKQHKLYSIRDYLLLDSNDEIICRGTSAWLLLDSKTHRPKILTQIFPEITMHSSKDALADLPEKINSSYSIKVIYKTMIRYSDIDLNQHANNAKYIEMMLDCFNIDYHSNHSISFLVVSFTAESKFGDEIQLSKGIEKENQPTHYVEAKNLTTNKTVFRATVEWKS